MTQIEQQSINLTLLQKYLMTVEDGQRFQQVLENATNKLFQTDADCESILKENLPYDVATFLIKLANEYKVPTQDKTNMQQFLHQLIEAISSIPVISLTLAIPAKEAFIRTIQEWFLRNYQKLVLLDIHVDTKLIAGGIIQLKGKYHDYSVRKLIEESAQPTGA